MSLLNKLLKPPKKKPAKKKTPARKASAKPKEPPMTFVRIDKNAPIYHVPVGEEVGKVFVYDGRPLAKVSEGETLHVELIQEPVHMESIYTGTTCTEERKCVAYNGKAIGFVAGPCSTAMGYLFEKHPRVTITAQVIGHDKKGWPIVQTLLNQDAIYDEIKTDGVLPWKR